MMIKVLIVDDELLGRMMIRNCINWEDLGYTICGECSDGDQAIMMIDKLMPQIVITDVKMNHMNGDALVRYIYSNYPQICTIVLSGYDDYVYVRDVLKHNAIDYIIKNDLTPEVMLESLKKAEEILSIGPQIKKSETNLHTLRQQFGLRLLSGDYAGQESKIKEEISTLRLNLPVKNIVPVLMVITNAGVQDEKLNIKERMLIDFSVCNVLEEIIKEDYYGMVISMQHNEFILLIALQDRCSESRIQEELNALTGRCSFCLEKYMRLSTNFHIGTRTNLSDIHTSFARLNERRRQHFLDVEGNNEKQTRNLEYNDGKGLKLEDERMLTLALADGDQQACAQILNSIFDSLSEEGVLRSGCAHLFHNLIILAISICKKYGISFECIYQNPVNIIEYVGDMERLKDCRSFFLMLFEKINLKLQAQAYKKQLSAPIQKAVRYINENYKSAISLADLADELEMNSSYLSSLFKNEIGIGFSEYLNDIRLERAKELLDQGTIKLKKVVEESGFETYPYFFRQFKKKYDMTPKQYQNSLT